MATTRDSPHDRPNPMTRPSRWRHGPADAMVVMLVALAASGVSSAALAQPSGLPELVVEAPDHLSTVADRIGQLDAGRLAAVMRLTGLTAPGRPIRVVLVQASSRIARDTPPWVAAFADAGRDLIVLFPDRIGAYPYNSLEVVIHHEVAHVLAARAAGGGRLPRWFNEGVASTAERSWSLANRSRFIWESVSAGEVSVTELEGLFAEGRRESARAYVLSHAFVRSLLQRFGPDTVRRILDRVAAGDAFDQAFVTVTGTTVTRAARLFWQSASGWEEWLTFVASPYTLWSVMTALSLVAIWRHRQRRAKRRRRWEAEERAEDQEWEEHRRNYRIH